MQTGVQRASQLVQSSSIHSAQEQALSQDGPRWYAVYTRSRHEKQVQQQLVGEALDSFLPVRQSIHRWNDRSALVSLPLFPGYLFVRILMQDRLRVLKKPGVVTLVGTHGRPTPVPDYEIEALRACLARRARMEPHAYLTVGERVRVWSGPFAEIEGILLRKKNRRRLVLSVNLIGRSVAVELDSNDVIVSVKGSADA